MPAVGVVELFRRANAAFPEGVGVGGPAVQSDEILEKGIAVPAAVAIEKEVGQPRELAIDLGKPRVVLQAGSIKATEFSQRHEKPVIEEPFAGSRDTTS